METSKYFILYTSNNIYYILYIYDIDIALSENWERQKSHGFQEILPGSSFSRKMPLGRSGTHGPTQQKYGGFLEYTSILRGFSIIL